MRHLMRQDKTSGADNAGQTRTQISQLRHLTSHCIRVVESLHLPVLQCRATCSTSLDKCRNPSPSRSMVISFSDCAHACFPAFELASPTKCILMHLRIDNDENTRTEHWTLNTSVEKFLIRFSEHGQKLDNAWCNLPWFWLFLLRFTS